MSDAQQEKDEARKAKAFAYQVEVCKQIKKDWPDVYLGNGFPCFDFDERRMAENERINEAFEERIRKYYPDAQPYSQMYDGRTEYGSGKVAGWSTILHAQRKELERHGNSY
jgi:hypothetical protein